MRKLPIIVVLSFLLACCTNSVDRRLAVADSLMQVTGEKATVRNSDSAYLLMSNLAIDSFATDRERSIFAIVNSHARFRHDGVMTIGDLSDLCEAVAYFAQHKDDKNYYPRACIMKSIALQKIKGEENSVTESIRLYRTALDGLKSDEHFWRGYAHYHLAGLYYINRLSDSARVRDHYLAAAREYAECGDRQKEAWSYCEVAKYYYLKPNDSMEFYVRKSMDVPLLEPDHYLRMMNLTDLCVIAHNRHEYREALRLIKHADSISKRENIRENQIYYYMASCYAHLGYTDSARMALREAGEPRPDLWLDNYARRTIAEAEGDFKSALAYADNNYRVRMDGLANSVQRSMLRSDLEISNARLESEKSGAQKRNYLYGLILAVVVAVLMSAIAINTRIKRKNAELQRANEQLHNDKRNLERMMREIETLSGKDAQNGEMSPATNEMINEQFKLLRSIFNDLNCIKDVEKIGNRLKLRTFGTTENNFIKSAEAYLNATRDNIISNIREKNDLSDSELSFLIMDLCGFSPTSIQYVMGFKNDNYVYKKRAAIAKKLGVDSLKDLVER